VSAISAPADRRFRRARLKPTGSRHGWRRANRWIRYVPAILLAACAAYLASQSLVHARVLRIERVLVRGNDRLAHGEVLALLSGLRGQSLIWTDLGRWRERLLSSPWVRDAALRRSLPSTVEIVLWERQPIGIGRVGEALYLVDEHGTIVDQYGPQYAELDLPIVDGLAASSTPDGPAIDPARAALASRVIGAVRSSAALARRVSQVNVADVHNVQVILTGDSTVVSLGDDEFAGRLQSYLELSETLRQSVADIDGVDVRFDNRIYVRPARNRGRAQTPARPPGRAAAGRASAGTNGQ
jgi:cell division septal protein FtsQ